MRRSLYGSLFSILLTFGFPCAASAEKAETFQTYYDSGALKGEFPVKNGYLEGPARWYYQSGALGAVMSYRGNRLEGVSKTFYENGNVKKIVTMHGNKPVGVSRVYSETGRLSAAEIHQQGRRVGLWVYDTDGLANRCDETSLVGDRFTDNKEVGNAAVS